MEKKFTKRLMLMGLCSTAVTLALCVLVFFTVFERQAAQDVRIYSDIITAAYYQNGHSLSDMGVGSSDLRVTLIQPDGTVLFDNAVSGNLENHLGRPEVRDALAHGEGHAERHSDTTSQNAYYYAVRLDDGNILRVASDLHSRFDLFRSAIPVLLVCCLIVWVLGWLLSLLLTRQLVQPIVQMGNRLDELDRNVPYPELQPFVDAILRDRDTRRQSETMRQEFTANVSHELKTPMTTIAGFMDGMLDGTIPREKYAYYMQTVSDEVKRLSRLVRSMLDISRLKSTGEEIVKSRFDVTETLGRTLLAFEQKIEEKRLDVQVNMPEKAVYVMANEDAITQVIYNLIDNGVKFAEPGTPFLLTVAVSGGKALVSVADTGPEIPPEELPLVFDRFHKSDKSRSQHKDGVGLGLYIVKTILGSHGEDITVTSRGGLTTFTFTLALGR